MQAFGGKRCYFLRRYQKNQKKPKILESWRRRGLKSPKSLVFLVFLVPLQENASFWWKTLPFPEEVPKKPKTSSSTSKQKHIFRFDKNPIDSSCFQVPDSGFKFQDLAIARISLVHSTATYKDRGKVRYLQCFLLRYGSLSTLQDSPGELQKLLGWILGGGATIYIYIHIGSLICGVSIIRGCKGGHYEGWPGPTTLRVPDPGCGHSSDATCLGMGNTCMYIVM